MTIYFQRPMLNLTLENLNEKEVNKLIQSPKVHPIYKILNNIHVK